LRLTLDLDLAGETVAGVVGDGDGAGEPFTGWVGLTRSIELAIEAHRRPDANQPGRER
jgi:hypothetical protein